MNIEQFSTSVYFPEQEEKMNFIYKHFNVVDIDKVASVRSLQALWIVTLQGDGEKFEEMQQLFKLDTDDNYSDGEGGF